MAMCYAFCFLPFPLLYSICLARRARAWHLMGEAVEVSIGGWRTFIIIQFFPVFQFSGVKNTHSSGDLTGSFSLLHTHGALPALHAAQWRCWVVIHQLLCSHSDRLLPFFPVPASGDGRTVMCVAVLLSGRMHWSFLSVCVSS